MMRAYTRMRKSETQSSQPAPTLIRPCPHAHVHAHATTLTRLCPHPGSTRIDHHPAMPLSSVRAHAPWPALAPVPALAHVHRPSPGPALARAHVPAHVHRP
eukprot:361330-Chlamydomonas_euryale.AAC.5